MMGRAWGVFALRAVVSYLTPFQIWWGYELSHYDLVLNYHKKVYSYNIYASANDEEARLRGPRSTSRRIRTWLQVRLDEGKCSATTTYC